MTTMVVVMIAIFFHFEVIAILNRWAHGRRVQPRANHHDRPTLVIIAFALLGAHVAEIWLFGLAFWLLINIDGLGTIVGYDSLNFWDCVYFSATTYTTVGWGDLSAVGPVRFLAGTESLVGFMLITWSASFTYLVMARAWGTSAR